MPSPARPPHPSPSAPDDASALRWGPSTALRTDHYELTMVDAALRSGVASHRCVFEVFARGLPPGRRYGVVVGTGRLIEELASFRFGPDELAFLEAGGFLAPETLEWLSRYRFGGSITGYREGELYFPGSPVLTVEATFAEAVVLETLALSVLNHDSAVASAAARMVSAAAGRPLIEAGGRRTHEAAASAAARAAYIAGFASTSNLEAGRRWGIPTGGTTAHAFILAHRTEAEAFAAQVAMTGPATTLLVDTYDVAEGIRRAVEAAGPGLGAIRIDSGDLAAEAHRARALLDSLGAVGTRIVVSGDLDELSIAALRDAPVDRMLVGTQLVTGSGAPTAGMVYKLVAMADRPGPDAPLLPVAKRSAGKATRGGMKLAGRRIDATGRAVSELVADADHRPALSDPAIRSLQVPYVRHGEVVRVTDLEEARAHHAGAKAELGPGDLDLSPGPPALRANPIDPLS